VPTRGRIGLAEVLEDLLLPAVMTSGELHHALEPIVFGLFLLVERIEVHVHLAKRHVTTADVNRATAKRRYVLERRQRGQLAQIAR
jgi:hypothetical protein